jgi:hypothetical protein
MVEFIINLLSNFYLNILLCTIIILYVTYFPNSISLVYVNPIINGTGACI